MRYAWIIGIVLFLVSCRDKMGGLHQDDTFKKTELLQQLADNYILPSYTLLQQDVTSLATSWSSFDKPQLLI